MNVEPRKLPVYSASQIGDYTDCPRKWGLAKIDRLHKPQHASAKLGEAAHKQLERYLLGHGLDFASDPRAADIAATMVEHLPPPNFPGMEIEASFTEALAVYEMRTAEDTDTRQPTQITRPHLWTGRLDWTINAPTYFVVGDHKTTSNIDAYAKDTDELREDPQVLIYGMWALTIRPDLGSISFQWTYGQTRGAKRSQPVTIALNRNEIVDGFAKIDAVAQQMTRARESVQSGIELPYNADACDKYGGCPFQARCNLSPIQRTPELPPMANGPSFLERLQQLGGTHAAPPVVNAAVTHARNGLPLPPKAVATGMLEIPGSAPAAYRMLAGIRSEETELIMDWVATDYRDNPAKYAPPAPQAPAWTPPTANAAPIAPPPAWTPPGVAAPPVAINPPEASLPFAPPTGTPPAAMVPTFPQAPVAAGVAPPAWTPPVADKPKRGRPPKANGSTVAEAAESATLVDVLYLGCRPVGEAIAVEATEIIAKAHARLCADAKVADYGMIDFGKGPGTLCAYVEQTITMEYGGKSIVLDIETREGQALGTKLSSLARLTIRRM